MYFSSSRNANKITCSFHLYKSCCFPLKPLNSLCTIDGDKFHLNYWMILRDVKEERAGDGRDGWTNKVVGEDTIKGGGRGAPGRQRWTGEERYVGSLVDPYVAMAGACCLAKIGKCDQDQLVSKWPSVCNPFSANSCVRILNRCIFPTTKKVIVNTYKDLFSYKWSIAISSGAIFYNRCQGFVKVVEEINYNNSRWVI